MEDNIIIVTCPPKINGVLSREIESLGYKIAFVDRMGVGIRGSFNDTMRLNLHLRTGNRVLFKLKSFSATKPDELYRQFYKINWEELIDSDGYISVDSYVKNDFIRDPRFANLKAKDAIVDKLYKVCGRRPDSGPDKNKTSIFFHWKLNHCNVFIDTSGETIAKHGYRKIPFKAPMIESLAAATILESQWNRNGHFVNPMCGSGTLVIEAAMMSAKIAPGLNRENFGFMHIKGYNYMYWEKLKKDAEAEVDKNTDFKIIATDISLEALRAAKENAKMAGVENMIHFEKCDFVDTTVPEGQGIVFLNPEYGERLGNEKELESVYEKIGDFFKKKCQGYMGYVFTGNLNLAKKIGLRTKRRVEFFNGKIDCRLLEYELYAGSKKDR